MGDGLGSRSPAIITAGWVSHKECQPTQLDGLIIMPYAKLPMNILWSRSVALVRKSISLDRRSAALLRCCSLLRPLALLLLVLALRSVVHATRLRGRVADVGLPTLRRRHRRRACACSCRRRGTVRARARPVPAGAACGRKRRLSLAGCWCSARPHRVS